MLAFNERIAKARRDAGLSRAELADACDVSRATVGNWENANAKKQTRPQEDNLDAIVAATKVSKGWLLTGKTEISKDWNVSVSSTGPDEKKEEITNINDSFLLQLLDVVRLLTPENQKALLLDARRKLATNQNDS